MQKALFIGNSHTYFNAMPEIFKRIANDNGHEILTAMIAHGGVGLDYHIGEPEAVHNITYGKYDFVILQDMANPYCEERLFSAGKRLADYVHKSGALGILYMPWQKLENREKQNTATNGHLRFAKENTLVFAPAGEAWWKFYDAYPEIGIFADDKEHASEKGSYLAACCIYCAVFGECPKTDGEEIHSLMAKIAYETYSEYKNVY